MTAAPIIFCTTPSGGISNPAAGAYPVSNGTVTLYQLNDNVITSMGTWTLYNADPNGPSGGIPASSFATVAISPHRGNAWVTGVLGWQTTLNRQNVGMQAGHGGF